MSFDELEALKLSYKLLLDRSIALFGASGSGKSAIIIDLLHHLHKYINQIVVFSPTDPSNGTYSEGPVPPPLIHHTLDIETLEIIWARQEAMTAAYKRANNSETLKSLYSKLHLSEIDRMLSRINDSKRECIDDIIDTYFVKTTREGKITKIKKKYDEFMVLIYKTYINRNIHKLSGLKLNIEEQYALKFINFNPRVVLVFDDCAAELKRIEKSEIFRKLFYQNRHVLITVIIACQDDKDIESGLRKNAFINMFTTDTCANAYFTRKANDFPKAIQKQVDYHCTVLEWDEPHFEKMVYMREERKLYKFVAEIHDNFQFGGPLVRKYCGEIKRVTGSMDKNNPFYAQFG